MVGNLALTISLRSTKWSGIGDVRCHPSLREARLVGLEESQRDSGAKPKVARHELPWEYDAKFPLTPTGLRRIGGRRRTQPRWGCGLRVIATQGSARRATLGWRMESTSAVKFRLPSALVVGRGLRFVIVDFFFAGMA